MRPGTCPAARREEERKKRETDYAIQLNKYCDHLHLQFSKLVCIPMLFDDTALTLIY